MKPLRCSICSGRSLSLTSPAACFALLSALILLLVPARAGSATNYVTALDDYGSWGCLRTAVALAQAGDTIQFTVNGTILLTGGELPLLKDLIVLGAGPETLAVSGCGSNRVFKVGSGVRVVISGITVTDGRGADGANGHQNPDLTSTPGLPGEPGGAILTAGTLYMQNCVITNSVTGKGGNGVSVGGFPPRGNPSAGGDGGAGGGIYNSGSLTLSNCTIVGNSCGNGGVSGSSTWAPVSGAGGCGGGIYNTGILVLTDSVITSNRAGNGDHTPFGPGPDGGAGGGVWNRSNFAAFRTVFSGNFTGNGGSGVSGGAGGAGGGVWDTGTMTLLDCAFSNNVTGGGGYGGGTTYGGGSGGGGGVGGAILTSNGLLSGCTVFKNSTGYGGDGGSGAFGGSGGGGGGGDGAGIQSLGQARLTNCTISANACGAGGRGGGSSGSGGAGGSGGGISFRGSNQVMVSCTVASNLTGFGGQGVGSPVTAGSGGGIAGNQAKFLNTIIALNFLASGEARDASGAFLSLGYNLVGVTNGCSGFAAPGDLTGTTNAAVDPLLAPLAFNGGPTPTMALLSGSPAIDSGSGSGIPIFDQRGLARPQGFGVDVGAYEVPSPVPRFADALHTSSNTFAARIVGMPNQTWLLETSSNLATWTGFTNVVLDEHGGSGFVDGTLGNDRVRLYRLRTR